MSPTARCLWTIVAALAVAAHAPAPPARVDLYGDTLPPDAIARLGTVRFRHGSYVSSMALSPDGKWLAIAGGVKTISIWDVATGKRTRLLRGILKTRNTSRFRSMERRSF